MADDITIGELGRALARLEKSQEAQTKTLGEIKVQTTETNGRVKVLESRATHTDVELKRLNSAVFPRHGVVDTKQPGAGDPPPVDLRLSPRMYALLATTAAGFSMLMPAINTVIGKVIESWFQK